MVSHISSMGVSHITHHSVVLLPVKFCLVCVSHAPEPGCARCNNLVILTLVYWIVLLPQCMNIQTWSCNSKVFLWWSFRCLVWLRLRLILGLTHSTLSNHCRSWSVSFSAFLCRFFVLQSCMLSSKILLIFCLCTCDQWDYLWSSKQIQHILRATSQLECLDIAMSYVVCDLSLRYSYAYQLID